MIECIKWYQGPSKHFQSPFNGVNGILNFIHLNLTHTFLLSSSSLLLLFSSDDLLSLTEFTLICRALFRNDKGHIYVVPDDQLKQMFSVFDKNQDGFIDRDEFQFCWNQWIKTVSNHHRNTLIKSVNLKITVILE